MSYSRIELLQNRILEDIIIERLRQDDKWGYPQERTLLYWLAVLNEEVGEVNKEVLDHADPLLLRAELVQVAAVCVSIIMHMEADHILYDPHLPDFEVKKS